MKTAEGSLLASAEWLLATRPTYHCKPQAYDIVLTLEQYGAHSYIKHRVYACVQTTAILNGQSRLLIFLDAGIGRCPPLSIQVCRSTFARRRCMREAADHAGAKRPWIEIQTMLQVEAAGTGRTIPLRGLQALVELLAFTSCAVHSTSRIWTSSGSGVRKIATVTWLRSHSAPTS